jgi:DNA-binding transcriptional LysR family regulator
VTPGDLADHACLSFTRLASHPEWRFRKGDHTSSVRVNGPLSADDAQSLIAAAISGAGIVMCFDRLAAPERADGKLVSILPIGLSKEKARSKSYAPRSVSQQEKLAVSWIGFPSDFGDRPGCSIDRHVCVSA